MILSTKYVLLRATVIEMHDNELDRENCCTGSTWLIVGVGRQFNMWKDGVNTMNVSLSSLIIRSCLYELPKY